jgi:hypothetical protein
MLLSLYRSPAILFEVMDKEASLVGLWTVSLVLGIGGFLLSRYRYWLGICALIVAVFLAWDQVSELRDPFVGPDIVREAGHGYVVQSYVAVSISVMLATIGVIFGWLKSHKRAT